MRIVTFNVQHGRTVAGAVDNSALAAYAKTLAPDLLALQEVDVGVPRSGLADQAAAVGRAVGARWAFGSASRVTLVGRYGNALAVRGRLDDVETLRLPRAGRREPRAAVLATATVDGTRVSVAATHLSVERVESLPQLAAVIEALSSRPLPRVLMGDLNLPPDVVGPVVEDAGMALADPSGPTFPADAPTMRIDHVAVAGLDICAVKVLAPPPVSDHRALAVEVSVEGAGC